MCAFVSENTINRALGAIRYKRRLEGMGARHIAPTWLRGHGWNRDYVEAQPGYS